MKNLILLFILASCTATIPTQKDRANRTSTIERTRGCVTEIMERFGESSKEALETCLAIYRRK